MAGELVIVAAFSIRTGAAQKDAVLQAGSSHRGFHPLLSRFAGDQVLPDYLRLPGENVGVQAQVTPQKRSG
jgi:hypothetical protein